MIVNEVKSVLDKIEEDFKFNGGSVDFISDFRTKVAELQDVHFSEGGESSLSGSSQFVATAAGFASMSMAMIATFGGPGAPMVNDNEVLGPQAEACFNKLHTWLCDEGKV